MGTKKSYECRFMENPPVGVSAWIASGILREDQGTESRFYPYNSKEAEGLILDATIEREVTQESASERGTMFSMAYGQKGWHIYIQCNDPDAEKLADSQKDIPLELYFAPGLERVPYYQMSVSQLKGTVHHYDWGMPHRDYRSLKDHVRVETQQLDQAFATHLFIPWEALYDRLPLDGTPWLFNVIRWNPAVTWSGLVHETGNFGLINFTPPTTEQRQAIERHVSKYGWFRFKRLASRALKHWSDPEMGDPTFAVSQLQALIDKHESAGEQLGNPYDWSSTTVASALPLMKDWMEFDYLVSDLRMEYLREQLLPEAEMERDCELTCFEVPAVSSIQRLPDVEPRDAIGQNQLNIVGAGGERCAASFVIQPPTDYSSVQLIPTDLRCGELVIPACEIDLKVVQCWYQAGTAWYSYFADSNRRELVPELLLNDESLVNVDQDTRENYLRVGSEYRWVSYPRDKREQYFNYMTEPVADAKEFQPVALTKNTQKQFWVTAHIPSATAAGCYTGKILICSSGGQIGEVNVRLRVLPFDLPMPKTYYNLANPFLVTIYYGRLEQCRILGIDPESADIQARGEYENLLKHNVFNCKSTLKFKIDRETGETNEADIRHEIRMMREAGFVMKPFLSSVMMWETPESGDRDVDDLKERLNRIWEILKDELGHDDIYFTSWDEAPALKVKVMRELSDYIHEKGIKLWVTTAKGRHFDLAGYGIDYANHGGWPQRGRPDTWHALGAKISSYAGPHTGPENPDVFRRFEGLARYKANYDGSHNYKYYSALHTWKYEEMKQNVWNDFSGASFRTFNMVYPTIDGVIDTLAWEGFRTGIDDIRYATQLKQDAERAIASGNNQAAILAKKALIWLELVDESTEDLNAVRMEMVHHILKIRKAMD